MCRLLEAGVAQDARCFPRCRFLEEVVFTGIVEAGEVQVVDCWRQLYLKVELGGSRLRVVFHKNESMSFVQTFSDTPPPS